MRAARKFGPHPKLALLPILVITTLSGCDGDLGGTDSADNASGALATYTVGGTVSGLAPGESVILRNNNADSRSISSNGAFAFATASPGGTTYAITVGTQPVGELCTVVGGTGTISTANVSDAAVTCMDRAFRLGGSIQGLTSAGLVLADGSDTVTVSGGTTTFTLPTPIAFTSRYTVTVNVQPAGQSCAVMNGSGVMPAGNVMSVSVSCTDVAFTVGGNVSGLSAGQSVQLLNNGTDPLTASANGPFAFHHPLAAGATYAVSIGTQPINEHCSVSYGSGSGTVPASPITSIAVTCAPNLQRIGGTVSGLTAGQSIQLTNNGADALTISADGSFDFATSLPSAATYNVSVKIQPSVETCTVTNSVGTVGPSNVSNVTVGCVPRRQFALVSNNSDNTISVYTVDPSTFAFSTVPGSPFTELGTAGGPQVIAVSPVCPFAYVANNNDTNVSAFAVDPVVGALAAVPGSPFATGLFPQGVAISPDCSRLYVTNNGDSTLSGFSIDPNSGALVALAGSPYTLGMSSPYGVTFDATGRRLYVADESMNGIFAFSLDPATGAPTAIAGSPYSTGNNPRNPQVHPNGSFLYVANADSNNVSVYSIDPTTGALNEISGSPFPAGTGPFNVSIHPGGLLAYVPNVGDNTISGYAINPNTGAFSALAGSPFSDPSLNGPIFLAVNPTGTLAAAVQVGGNTIVTFAINGANGTLTSTGTSLPTGAAPVSIAISP